MIIFKTIEQNTLEILFKGMIVLKKIAVLLAMLIGMCCCSATVSANDLQEISAKGAVVIDGRTGEILFEKNAYEQLPMASTTKIMTTLLALESGNLDEEFTVDSQAIKVEGSSMGLQEGDCVTMRALCYGMMLPSGNDAANCTAVRVAGSIDKFVDMMNERAEEMGLESTHFVTPSGLDDDTDEHYSTAYDMAMLAREAMQNEDFREICSSEKAQVCFGNPPFDRWLINSNKLLKNCSGVIGIKTGFTDKARRCLVSACERDGAMLICVTLNAPNDWQDHSALYDYCFGFMENQTLHLDRDTFSLNVVGGEKDAIKCVTEPAEAVLLKGRANKVSTVIKLPKFVYAPVKLGDKVGQVEYYYNDILIESKDIFATEFVSIKKAQKKGFFEKCKEKLLDFVS